MIEIMHPLIPGTRIIDTRGLLCPHPLLKAKLELKSMMPGEHMQIISNDPSSQIDFAVFVRQTGHIMLEFWQEKADFYFVISKT